jgi:hypothetical protein
MPDPDATTDSPSASLLDYFTLFVDHLLPATLCHGFVIFFLHLTSVLLHREMPFFWLGLAFGSLLVTSAIGLLGGMVCSVQK